MPHKSPEARRAYYAEVSTDPIRAAKRKERQRIADAKKPKRPREKSAETQRIWYFEHGGKERRRKAVGAIPIEEFHAKVAERKARRNAYMQEWNKTEAGHRARTARSVKKRCGLSIDDYDAAYDAQHGKCAICSAEHPRYGKDRLSVDHCHKLGTFRALLCTRCNTGIGMFREDVTIMEQAIAYIRERT